MNASAKRRRAPEDEFPEVDSENVDPSLLSPAKKAKGPDGTPAKPPRPQQFVLKANGSTYSTPTHAAARAILTPKRLALSTAAKPVSSAPAVAGRSPTKKRAGVLSRRRVSASPFTRVDPPAFGLAGSRGSGSSATGNGLPFSIDAALSGTVPTAQPKAAAAPPVAAEPAPLELPGAMPCDDMPRAWHFDIHEDTPDEELGNLMEFSTQTLDLSSDDESKAREREERGKENVPPENFAAPAVAPPATRKDQMIDEPRTPLGDLDARAFYAPDYDQNSFVIVPGDKEDVEAEKPQFAFAAMAQEEVRTPCPVDGASANQDAWLSLLAQVDAPAPAEAATPVDPPVPETEIVEARKEGSQPPIEIWESESAKDESEDRDGNVIAVTETLAESLAAVEAKADTLVERALAL